MAVATRTTSPSRIAPLGLLRDDRLVRLAAAGHQRAFAVVYERHHQALYRYCRSILRNDADAQDALQSTFTAAFAALRRGGPNAPIRPWLFRIAHNEAVSALRRRKPTVELSDAIEHWTTSVEDQVADRGRLELLLGDLRELHDRQRSALVMRELSGLSHEEIALALETSLGAAKQAIYEARRSLFEFAEGRAMRCDEIRQTISDADGRLLRSRRVRAHLRECSGCAAFAAAISTRERELRALVPVLPAAAAAGLLGRVAGVGSAHGTGTGVAGLAIAGAGKTAGAGLAANALAGVAVVATATVGVTFGVDRLAQGSSQSGAGRHGTPAARSVAAHHRTPVLAVSPAGHAGNGGAHSARLPTTSSAAADTMPSGERTRSSAEAPSGSSRPISTSPGHSGAAPGHSTTTSTSPGHSGAAPGHSPTTSTSLGHSGAAPGHSPTTSTSPGHAGAAPGHSPTTSTSSGHAGAAPGRSSKTSTSPGYSGAAPARPTQAGGGNTERSVATVPSVPALPPLPVDPAVTRGASATPPGHLK
ncbi:MAG TPA: sigma-70 family RNA polymerase sigma factor [Solirubrobacteraceae bacterium]|nr:sigma-70 family RNA polymerase sigma factor [Solirubrobacteraceae bacterium]